MKTLKPVNSRKTKDLKNEFFVFDTETTGLSPKPENFVFGVIYGWNYCNVINSIEDFIKEFEHKRYRKKFIFAHNAEYDILTLFGNIQTNFDNSAIFNGKFISAKYKGITFADSLNIFPTSVKKLGEILGIEKHINEKIKHGDLTRDNLTQLDVNYCIRDCEVVFNSLLNIFESINCIKITLASISLYEFRKNFLDYAINYNEHTDLFFNSYYGGRTEAFKIGKVNATVYDINSLYPYSMANVYFPDPRNLRHITNTDVKYLKYCLMRYEGCAKIKVHHKDTYFGFLPFRDNDSGKLLFPIGTFETWVNFNEINFALKHSAIEILECSEIVFSNPIKSPFINFVNSKYTERKNSQNEFRKFELKLHLNSLYGKFAQRIKYKTTYFEQLPLEIINELQKFQKYYDLKMFSHERNDCYLIEENEELKNSFFSIPLFSSYITSHARITLLTALLQNESNKVVYCDTDSVFLEGEFIGNVGTELGQFKKEDKEICEIWGLKNYTIKKTDTDGWQSYERIIKGVRKGSIEIAYNTFVSVQYYKTKESLRNGKEAGGIKVQEKTISNKYDKRIVIENGETKPIVL